MQQILLGFYYGIGDFISAIPAIRNLSKRYNVTIAIGNQNKGLIDLVNLENVKVIYFPLFSISKIGAVVDFIHKLKKGKFDKILVSPHAQDAVTSWKIPIMLKYIKSDNTQIIGSSDDNNSFLYDVRLPIDKSIPLMQREIDFVKLAGFIEYSENIDIKNIFKLKQKIKKKKIVIHPGASRPLREWNNKYYFELVNLIIDNTDYDVIFIGLEKELINIKRILSDHKKVEFFSGSFKEVIEKTLDSSAIITMDSGFGHIASALGLNHFVLIGSANPKHIKPIYSNTHVVNIQKLSCQPCNGHLCKVGHNYCMDLITPKYLFDIIQKKGGFDDN